MVNLRFVVALLVAAVALSALVAAGAAAAGAPTDWEGLRLWPGQPLQTGAVASTWPALATTDSRLLLGEISQGAVLLSELDPATAIARWTAPVAAAAEGVERTHLQVAAVGNTIWLAWLEAPSGAAAGDQRPLQLAAFDLDTRLVQAPTEVAVTTQCALASHNRQLWILWLGPPDSGTLSLSSGPQSTAFVVNWQPPVPGQPVSVGAAGLGAALGLAFVSQDQGSPSLWQASYNGHRFFDLRKIRGLGEIGPPALARLGQRVLLAYSLVNRDAESVPVSADLLFTLADDQGGTLNTTNYVLDGRANLNPSLAATEGTVYVAYSTWSAPPGTSGASNLGLFLGRVTPAL